MTAVRSTHRWRGVVAVPLLAAAAGALFAEPSLLLLSVVGVTYAAYPLVTEVSSVDVAVERSVDAAAVDGEAVEVTVIARNVGDRPIPELRLVDDVPPSVAVVEGTPRHATALRPGGESSFSYAVAAERGPSRLGSTTVVARDLSGATEAEKTVEHDDTVTGTGPATVSLPLRKQTRDEIGRIASGEGGSGLEFHHVRRYRRGDPQNRIDWRRFARTGELSTVAFRLERAPSVAFCLDARPTAYRASGDDSHAVASGVGVVRRLYADLRETNARVGLAVLGREDWISPGAGPEHDARLRGALAAVPDRPAAVDGGAVESDADELRLFDDRLSAATQVVFVSPMTDEFAHDAALTLEAGGHAVTVVSADATAPASVGGRLAAVERARRLRSLRRAGVRVVDWDPSDPFESAVARAQTEWSA